MRIFFSFVLKIARHTYGIKDLMCWVDDIYSFEFAIEVLWHYPFMQLLFLWEVLGIPLKEEKQTSSHVLKIIGFEINVRAISVTLSDEARQDLIRVILELAMIRRRPKLSDF